MASSFCEIKRPADCSGLVAFSIVRAARLLLSALFFLLFVCFFSGCSASFSRSSRLLTGISHWQGVVRLTGDVVVDQDAELIIEPGTQVVFAPPLANQDQYREHPYFVGSELIVRGRLSALGTRQQPIIFRAENPDAAAGSWGSVNIEDSRASRFDYCIFQQADSAVHARQSQVEIRHSVFRRNRVGVRFHDTELRVEQNLFEENDTAIRFHLGSPLIRHNLIRNNLKGLFISAEPRNYQIDQNAFIDNRPYQVSLGEGVRESVNLARNFWSEAAGESLERLFFDGRIDEWLGRVDYLPVLEIQPTLEVNP